MPEDTLNILILAKDEASKVFKGVSSSLTKAFNVAAAGATVGVAALGAGLAVAVKEAAAYEETFAELSQVIESTGGVAGITADEAVALANAFQDVTKFSDQTIMRGETLLLTFTNIGEDVFPRTVETMLNMGEVFGSVDGAAIQLGKALNDPVAGISALSEVGVSFTEEQKELVAAMMETGDIAGAQTLILDELEREFGGVARAAGATFGGQLTILRNKLMGVATAIGMRLLPFLTKLVSGFISFLPKIERVAWVFGNFVETLLLGRDYIYETSEALGFLFGNTDKANAVALKLVNTFFDVWDVLKGFVDGILIPFVKNHLPAFKNALLAVGAVIGGAVVLGGILSLVGAIMSLINPITLVIGAIALLAMAWTEDWGGIRTFLVDTVWPAIQPILSNIVEWFEVNIPRAFQAATDIWNNVLKPTWNEMKGHLWTLFGLSGLLVKAMVENWGGIRDKIVDDVWPAIKEAFTQLASFLAVAIPAAIGFLKTVWDTVLVPSFNKLVEIWNSTLKPALQALHDFFVVHIMPAAEDLAFTIADVLILALTGISNLWNDTLKPALQSLHDFFQLYIPPAMMLVKITWDTVLKPALDALVGLWNDTVKPALIDFIDYLQSKLVVAFGVYKTTWETTMKIALQALATFWNDTLKPALQDFWDFLQVYIPPAMQLIADKWETVLKPALEALVLLWNDYIKPALQDLYDFFAIHIKGAIETLAPILQGAFLTGWTSLQIVLENIHPWLLGIRDMITSIYDKINELYPILEGAFKTAWETLQTALETVSSSFQAIKDALAPIAGFISDIGSAIDALPDIPLDWLPGSPPPFAVGLSAVADSMQDVIAVMPRLNSGMAQFHRLSSGGVADISEFGEQAARARFSRNEQGRGPDIRNIQYTLIVNSNAAQEPLMNDFRSMEAWHRSI